jgi:hypothetical protein
LGVARLMVADGSSSLYGKIARKHPTGDFKKWEGYDINDVKGGSSLSEIILSF